MNSVSLFMGRIVVHFTEFDQLDRASMKLLFLLLNITMRRIVNGTSGYIVYGANGCMVNGASCYTVKGANAYTGNGASGNMRWLMGLVLVKLIGLVVIC